MSAATKRWYEKCKKAGLCTAGCKRPAAQGRTKCETCAKAHAEASIKSHLKLKQEVFKHYGGLKCACCKENKLIEFLHIDHKAGGGNKHRKEIGGHSGGKFYRWLKRNDFPDGFQVLCADCNTAKGFYGQCPHEKQIGLKPCASGWMPY